MVWISSSDEFVVRCVHEIPDVLNLAGNLVHVLFWSLHVLECLVLNLLAMLVCSGLETNVVACEALVSCDAICKYNFVSVAYMRLARCVCNGSGDVIWFCHVKTLLKKNSTHK